MMLLGWTETKLWTLKYGSKSIQTSLILRQRPPKPYKLLKFFMISVILFKMGKHSDFQLSSFQIVGAWRDFTVVTKLVKNFKSLYGFDPVQTLKESAHTGFLRLSSSAPLKVWKRLFKQFFKLYKLDMTLNLFISAILLFNEIYEWVKQ